MSVVVEEEEEGRGAGRGWLFVLDSGAPRPGTAGDIQTQKQDEARDVIRRGPGGQ